MNLFDRIAANVARHVAHAWFFSFCILLVIIWFPTLFFIPVDSSQLIINTTTTIITFLLLALLHNSTQQFENAVNKKLDAQSKALTTLLRGATPNYGMSKPQYAEAALELEKSIGAEKKIGTE